MQFTIIFNSERINHRSAFTELEFGVFFFFLQPNKSFIFLTLQITNTVTCVTYSTIRLLTLFTVLVQLLTSFTRQCNTTDYNNTFVLLHNTITIVTR